MKCDVGFWECLPHLLRICRKFENRGEAKRLASGTVFRGEEKSAREMPRNRSQQRRPAELRRGVSELQIANQCFLVDDVVVVPVVPEVVVAVVPLVDVAVVEVRAVPEVSVAVPLGRAEVEVPELVVSVAIVPVVVDVSVAIVDPVSVAAAAVSVLLLLVSLLQAKPKTLSARTVTRTRSFLLMCFFLSIKCFCGKSDMSEKSACSPPLAIDEMVSAKRAASQTWDSESGFYTIRSTVWQR
jgi:hypothetical protein